jgi:hypothetical protein
MKSKKILIGIVFILVLGIGLQNSNIRITEHYKDIRDKTNALMTSNSLIYEWYRSWGELFKDEVGQAVTVDSSGCVYVAGYSESFGMVLLKYDEQGVLQWDRTYEGTIRSAGAVLDSSGNIYLAGLTSSLDFILFKCDENGIQQWNRTWGGIWSDYCLGLALDSSNNVYLVGNTQSFGTAGSYDMVLIKYNENGVKLWNHTWGGIDDEIGEAVAVDSSNNVYISGRTAYYDVVLVKYNGNGVQLWNRTWGGNSNDDSSGIAVDSSDNVYLGVTTWSFGAQHNAMVLMKYDSSGVLQWNRTWDTIEYDYSGGVTVGSSGNVYLAGTTEKLDFFSEIEQQDIVLLEYDTSGVQIWTRTWGVSSAEYQLQATYGVGADSFGNIYITGAIKPLEGHTNDVLLVKFSPDIYKPLVTIKSLKTNDLFGYLAPSYDISVNEPNLDSIWYTIDGGLTNHTITQLSGTFNQFVWNDAPYGRVFITFYARDIAGNVGFSKITVEKRFPLELTLILSSISGVVIIGVAVLLMRKRRKSIKSI